MHHSRRPSWIWPVAIGAWMAFALTASASDRDQFTEEFHRTVPLSADGRVSLHNINGGVTITGWERNEVQIDAVKSADSQQKLEEASIEVESSSSSVEIRTKYPEGRNHNNPATVTYELHVPRTSRLDGIHLVNGSLSVSQFGGDVRAELVNGSSTIQDLAGRTEISSVNGAVHAFYRSLENVKEVRLKSVNGSVNLGLPSSPNADVSVSTVNGGITTDFPLTVQGKFMSHHIDGKLGNGGTRIEINNVNGSVHIGNNSGAL
jgi:DUF4097 and DUF4098 domain-containing protein YvlB